MWSTATLHLACVTVAIAGSSPADCAHGRGPGITNHPVDVVPSSAVTVPADWPLDPNGAITCLTCHAEIPRESENSDPRLRELDWPGVETTEFCTRCHGGADGGGAGSVHWLAVGVAHVSGNRADAGVADGVLDAHTRQCLSCHDGVIATESKNTTAWDASPRSFSVTSRNHPVGVSYDHLSRPPDLTPLRPIGMLPETVPLPGGKVSCISCHDLYAGERHLLTVPILGSELCLACHDLG